MGISSILQPMEYDEVVNTIDMNDFRVSIPLLGMILESLGHKTCLRRRKRSPAPKTEGNNGSEKMTNPCPPVYFAEIETKEPR